MEDRSEPDGSREEARPEGAPFRCALDLPRNLLLAEGDPRPLHENLELHLLSLGVRHDPGTLARLKDGLCALGLYMVSRPRFESFGWTVGLQDPLQNLFFTGTAPNSRGAGSRGDAGSVVGRAFHEDVQPAPQNRFFAQTVRPRGEVATSSVDVEGDDIFGIVEQYCRRSDQQTARFFRGAGERVALLTTLPDADREWVERVEPEEVFRLLDGDGAKTINEHRIAFRCGCDAARIARVLTGLFGDDPEELFQGDPSVEAECPRCGAKYSIDRWNK